jgi:hypothetical protein
MAPATLTATNAVRLQLHALAYNLRNFMRTLAMPKAVEPWSLTSLWEEADQDWRKGRQPWPLRDIPDGRGPRVAAHVQGHPDAYCPASGAARTSLRGARIECDKQRRQGCAMTKAKHHVLRATRRNPSIPLPAVPIAVRVFCNGGPKTRQCALVCPARKNFFASVNYLTLLDQFLYEPA